MAQFFIPQDIATPLSFETKLELSVRNTERDGGVLISSFTEDSLSLDANHPHAGKDRTFEVELVEIA